MVRAIVFDLDGTLLNTLDDIANAGNHVLSVLGYPVHAVQAYKQMVGNGMELLVNRMLPPAVRGGAIQQLALGMYVPYLSQHGAEATRPYDGIAELLCALKESGVRMFVYSNKGDALAKEVVEYYFPALIEETAGHVFGTPPKPDAARILALLAERGIAPSEVLYAGDSDVDIYTAKNAGFASVGVVWGFRSREELVAAGAQYIAETPRDIFKLALR